MRLERQFTMTDYIDNRSALRDLSSLKPPSNLRPPQLQHTQQQRQSSNNLHLIDEVDNRGSSSPDYCFESVRLQSYVNWPVSFMDPAKLAAAGFYYTGEEDMVKCFECGVSIGRWAEGDNPMADHQRWQANCKFVRKLPCGNVPIGVDPSTLPPPSPRSRDVCGRYGEDYRPGSAPDYRCGNLELQYSGTAKLGSMGVLTTSKGPVHPAFASYESRLKTFESWPKSMPQTKEQLADAGFYYTGTGDQTLCYHCGGGLKDWEPKDDPWTQHAKWFKKCYYVLIVKGQAFINSVIGQPVTPPSREEMMSMNLPSCIQKVEQPPSPPPNVDVDVKPDDKKADADEKRVDADVMSKKSSDDARLCKICYNEELGVVFLPCGHMVACSKCAPSMTSCAVCREQVSMMVRAIIS